MSDTLYIQTEENVEVHHPHVYLQDIAKLSCTNSKILNHLRVLPVANLDPDKTGRYVISVMDLINDIQLKEPDLDITHIGEPNFIITYQKEGTVNIVIRWCKVIFVCLATFFGAGFSIMTFNNDVDIPALFRADLHPGHRTAHNRQYCPGNFLLYRYRSWRPVLLQPLR